jgi:hypothetical protein
VGDNCFRAVGHKARCRHYAPVKGKKQAQTTFFPLTAKICRIGKNLPYFSSDYAVFSL